MFMGYCLKLSSQAKEDFLPAKSNSFVGAGREIIYKMNLSAGKFLIVELLSVAL